MTENELFQHFKGLRESGYRYTPRYYFEAAGIRAGDLFEYSGRGRQTFWEWWRNHPELFDLVVVGFAMKLKEPCHVCGAAKSFRVSFCEDCLPIFGDF